MTYVSYKPKLKLLNSANTVVPSFGSKITKTFAIERPGFHFEETKNKLKEKYYEITFYDDVGQYLIKFHPNFFRWSNGSICGMITCDPTTQTASVTCFPMQGYTEAAARKTREVVDELRDLIVNA